MWHKLFRYTTFLGINALCNYVQRSNDWACALLLHLPFFEFIKTILTTRPAELIAFPERNYGSTILVSIFRAGKMGNAN
jgi:hypothetical protein